MTVRMLYGYITDYVRQREDRYIHTRPVSYVISGPQQPQPTHKSEEDLTGILTMHQHCT